MIKMKTLTIRRRAVTWSIPTPEDPGSKPVIGKIFQNIYQFSSEKTKINEKEAGNGPLKKFHDCYISTFKIHRFHLWGSCFGCLRLCDKLSLCQPKYHPKD